MYGTLFLFTQKLLNEKLLKNLALFIPKECKKEYYIVSYL